ncbi:DHH family phosphoesterase [Mycoplasma procyoni]|uniref:DHH family phosphoesterase n=1 Tax=Mycoplasma procyoni TaxID=568784 RepID=UPI00197C68AF|nr:DHH family phosphoesterase [Mycoplasma procyoni]MBN3534462.1 DHH family phosphoesterase [Mycoplasma procyoni]
MNNKKTWLTISFSGIVLFSILIAIFVILYKLEYVAAELLFFGTVFFLIVIFSLIVWIFWLFLLKSNKIQSSLYDYINEVVEENNLGLILHTTNGKIIWVSSFIEKRFSKKWLGKNINSIFNEKIKIDDENFSGDGVLFQDSGYNYSIKKYREKNVISIRDITMYQNLLENYDKEKIVIGEIEIDNYHLLLSSLGEEDFFNIRTAVVSMLDEIANSMNFTYRQYVDGRFWIITNYEVFEKLRSKNFSHFNEKEVYLTKGETKQVITFSAGFVYGAREIGKLNQLAKDALLYSKTRGGNQITTLKYGSKPITYGSNSEIDSNSSRSEINYVAKKMLDVLAKEEVKNIVLYGHKNADLDAIGSAYALGMFLKNYAKTKLNQEKEFYVQNITYDATTTHFINNNKGDIDLELLIKPSSANKLTDKNTLIIILDTADANRIENPNAFSGSDPKKVFIFDHHRIGTKPNFLDKGNEYIDTTASSTSEIVTEIIALHSTADTKLINAFAAQMLLNGVYMDTNQFKKSTSMKTFNAASLLIKWGGQSSKSIETLKMTEEIFNIINMIIKKTEEVIPGFLLAYTNEEVDIDVVSMAADTLLNIQGRKASFVVAKVVGQNRYKMSARGINNTNVQIIAEAVGGGGHFSASAAESTTENLEEFVDNIRQAIVSVRNESNIN